MMVRLHGMFPCGTTPSAQIEGLIAAHIPRRYIKGASEIYQTRWWDYRLMSPGHSFMLFAHTYYKAFRAHGATFMAHRNNHKTVGRGIIGLGEMFNTAEAIWDRDKRHITGMWNAMIAADALGIPYDHFCRLAFQIAKDQNWTHLPRPAQLYGEKLGGAVLYAWEERLKERFIHAKHPIYSLSNYDGSKVQDEYKSWLLGQLEEHSGSPRNVSKVVYQTPQISEQDAAKIVSDFTLTRAKRLIV